MRRYRWAVLGAGTFAQATFSAVGLGLPAIAPALREHFDLSLAELGVVLSAEWVGLLLTLLPLGILADRIGERSVLASGLFVCGGLLVAAAYAPSFLALTGLLALAGAAGGSVQAASGRAVMHWFDADQRGFALGVRQTAVPLGGVAAAAVLPQVGVHTAFVLLGVFCIAGALVGGLVLREAGDGGAEADAVPWTLQDPRLWRLCIASGLFLVGQTGLIAFVVLFLHDERGLSKGAAASVLLCVQLGAAALRLAVGRWSDLLRARIVPLRRIGVATFAALTAATALLSAPLPLLLPALVIAGAVSMAWNGLSFTAAAEFAGRARSGAAIGVQQSVLSAVGVATPVAFAAAVAATSWRAAYALSALFPLVGWILLAPLSERRGFTKMSR